MIGHWLFTPGLELEATRLSKSWAIRPAGAVGTMGWHPVAWEVVYVSGNSAADAISKAKKLCKELRTAK